MEEWPTHPGRPANGVVPPVTHANNSRTARAAGILVLQRTLYSHRSATAIVADVLSVRQPSSPAMQVHNRYLVTETTEGVVVIDQHALHERILYEQFRDKGLAGVLESQHLLVPEPVDLGPSEAAVVLAPPRRSRDWGFRSSRWRWHGACLELSGDAVVSASRGAPRSGRSSVPEDRHPDRRDLLDELLHMISCKAAIKAGDRLSTAKSPRWSSSGALRRHPSLPARATHVARLHAQGARSAVHADVNNVMPGNGSGCPIQLPACRGLVLIESVDNGAACNLARTPSMPFLSDSSATAQSQTRLATTAAPVDRISARLGSVDAYRGLVMFLMMAEVLRLPTSAARTSTARCGGLAFHQPTPWTGCSLHDLIQPSFSLLVGLLCPFRSPVRSRGQS